MYKSVVIFALSLLSALSFAQNTGGVFGPAVNEGHRSFQYRSAYDPSGPGGDSAFAQRFHYQQAIDGDFMWRVVGQTRKTVDSNTDFDYVQAELFWQLDQTDDYLSGVRFDARVRDSNRPNQIGFNWMHQYNLSDDWTARLLLLTTLQFGDNAADGVLLQTRFSVGKNLSFGQVGVELFNSWGSTEKIGSLNDQNHSIGPYISRALGENGWSLFAGALFGATKRAPDTEFRLWITKSL